MSGPGRLITCVDCGELARHNAKDRCVRCYARHRVQMIDCGDCGRRQPEHRGGRCARCYRDARAVFALCAGCGQQRRCWAGTCDRCKRARRATAGRCVSCGRTVARLWSRRCARCAHGAWQVGSCTDCHAWAASVAGTPPRCRACRDFTRRNQPGPCRSCRRRLAVNGQQRCRLCAAARRHEHRIGASTRTGEPAQRGIQLVLGDLESARRPPRVDEPDEAAAADRAPQQVDGQLELFTARPDPRDAGPLAQAWASSPAGQARLAELTAFATARGWPAPTVRATQRALAITTVSEPSARALSRALVTELRRRHLPVARLREFLASQHGEHRSPSRAMRALNELPADLPAAIKRELSVWVEALASTKRRGRPRAETTIAAYLRAVVPAVTEWAPHYGSLREISSDDVATHVASLTGSRRTGVAVALRSLFATLKSQRLIFTDPARRVRPGRFPPRPVLGLNDTGRAGLLTNVERADHRLALLLAGVHALTRAQIITLRLDQVDLSADHLQLPGRRVHLDALTCSQLRDWLEHRRGRWPHTANPHLLISAKSALSTVPVSTAYLRGLPIAASVLRADRLLGAARDSGADPLTLVRLFAVSDDTAVRYCIELDDSNEHLDTGR